MMRFAAPSLATGSSPRAWELSALAAYSGRDWSTRARVLVIGESEMEARPGPWSPGVWRTLLFLGFLPLACESPKAERKADEHLIAARELAESDPEAALAALAQVTRAEPAEVSFLRGTALEGQKKLEEAVRAYEAVLRLKPGDAAARLALGRTKLRLGQASSALPHLGRVVSERPGWLSAILFLVVAQAGEEPRKLARRALLAWPEARTSEEAQGRIPAEYYLALASVAESDDERDLLLKKSESADLGSIRANILLSEAALAAQSLTFSRALLRRLAASPASMDELVVIADLALAAGETSAAVRALRRIPAHKRSLSLLILRGRAELATAHPKRALAQFAGALALVKGKDENSRAEAEYWMARAHHADGNGEQAFALSSELVTRAPEHRWAQLLMSDLEIERGEPTLAVRRLRDLEQKFPGDPEILLRLATAHEARKDYPQAETTYKRYLVKVPDDISVALRLSESLRRQGKTLAERRLLTAVHEKHPESIAALRALASESMRAGALGDAISLLERAMKNAKDPVPNALLLAETFESMRKPKSALLVLRQLVLDAPRSARAFSALGQAEFRARDFEAAEKSYRKALELEPDSPRNKARLSRVLAKIGQAKEAEELLRDLAEVPKNDVAAQVLTALTHVDELDDPRAALPFAERAYELSPDDPSALDALGWVLVKSENKTDLDRALLLLKRAAAIGGDPVYNYHRGVALIRAGRKDEGRSLIRKAVQEAEWSEWRAVARSFLVP